MVRALEAITRRTNLSTGLTHLSDRNAAKEKFLRLHQAGEPLRAREIEYWAGRHGWLPRDAADLGALAEAIGQGRRPRIRGGPYWAEPGTRAASH
ncbi:MAG: hypothetical protein ABIP48_04285 [Planctomycetota bacterium]